MRKLDTGKAYRTILIIDSRAWWHHCLPQFDPLQDVVLTYDFGLVTEIEKMGGKVFFVDHLIDKETMHENNLLIYKFFREWFFDSEGNDIFQYQNVSFGFSFRLEIWNDFVFYARTQICLEILGKLQFEKMIVGTELGLVESILQEMGLAFSPCSKCPTSDKTTYYFPIHNWMDEKVRFKGLGGLKYRLRDIAGLIQGLFMSWVDRLAWWNRNKPVVFIQEYHPTRKLIQQLQRESKVRLILATFTKSPGAFRYIPVWGRVERYQKESEDLIKDFQKKRCSKLVLKNGTDISPGLYRIIEERIANRIPETLRTLDCVIRYMDSTPIKLEILIANLGHIAPLVDCVCKARNIPCYFIINGIVGNEYLDEGKYATVINSYSISIKEHYFKGMDNIVCLGDPRMDSYVVGLGQRVINRDCPTISIGASGHNNIDLNSYLAVEFDFLFDVLSAIASIKSSNVPLHVILKVRANGYLKQYEAFINEYFPSLKVEILDNVPIMQVLARSDFFISIYSQTLFEASCLGIPCLYYKKDTEIIDPPFDGNSELVSVTNIEDLVNAIEDFRSGNNRYDAFLDRLVMEKYIGPLDGGNLERNLNFIYELLERFDSGAKH
jgi:hypothetical protein